MPTALIAGASGLIGRHLLDLLMAAPEYDRVVSLGRRKLEIAHPKLEQVVVDFSSLDRSLAGVQCDDVFCCLGTTIRRAGSRENFRAVDHAAVLALGWAARRQGARRFFLVSSMGADPHSRVFYSRVKGETEEALLVLDFDTLALFRPSLLLGRRTEVRPGERVMAAVLGLAEPLLLGRLRKYRAIEGVAVARAMLRSSFGEGARGLLVYASDEIQDIGGFGD